MLLSTSLRRMVSCICVPIFHRQNTAKRRWSKNINEMKIYQKPKGNQAHNERVRAEQSSLPIILF